MSKGKKHTAKVKFRIKGYHPDVVEKITEDPSMEAFRNKVTVEPRRVFEPKIGLPSEVRRRHRTRHGEEQTVVSIEKPYGDESDAAGFLAAVLSTKVYSGPIPTRFDGFTIDPPLEEATGTYLILGPHPLLGNQTIRLPYRF